MHPARPQVFEARGGIAALRAVWEDRAMAMA